VALFIVGLTLAALSSSVVFLSRALPRDGGPGEVAGELSELFDRLREDVGFASSAEVVTGGGGEVSLVLPDLDGDGVDEVAVYWFDEQAVTLSRSWNGLDTHVVEGVELVELAVELGDADDSVFGDAEEGRIALYGMVLGSILEHRLEDGAFAQPVTPALDGSTEAWSVDRVVLSLKRSGSGSSGDEPVFVSVYEAEKGSLEPVGVALAKEAVEAGELSGSTVTVSFDDPAVLSDEVDAVVVVETENDEAAMSLSLGAVGEPRPMRFVGGAWASVGLSSPFAAYGRESSAGVALSRLIRVRMEGEAAGFGAFCVGARSLVGAEVDE